VDNETDKSLRRAAEIKGDGDEIKRLSKRIAERDSRFDL
jgi:hypothetical protein